jgi:hypothetical protein
MSEQAKQDASEVVRLNDVDLFAAHLVAWHERKIAIIQHFLEIPEGTKMAVGINNEEEKEVTLTGDVLTAFRGGLATALGELDTLPFEAIPVQQEEAANGNG